MSMQSREERISVSTEHDTREGGERDVGQLLLRTGEIEDREPVATGDGGRVLRCPDCGHMERRAWLPEEARQHTFQEAESRQLEVA